jgi:penicillin-binding protein 1A
VPQPGDFLSNFFQSAARGASQQTTAQQYPTGDSAYVNGGNSNPSPTPMQTSPRPYPQPSQNAYPPARPPVTQTSSRPEAASGLDSGGWLMDRLFGNR